ncbi:MAG: pentapeptide repeat protein [Bacteroidota bacterium]|nr:pentapeptide repeat protein [Bacteroidota bacterium]
MKRIYFKTGLIWFFILVLNNLCNAQTKTVAQWVVLAKSGQKDLSGANFTGSDLSSMDLSSTDLTGANLTGVNLSGANLRASKLYSSNLTGVNFTGANLSKANFLATNMKYVNLKDANLQQALLQEADLEYAILNHADLTSANLILANLQSADLQNADLSNVLMTYESLNTPESKTVYGEEEAKGSVKMMPAPEIVETGTLGAAMEKFETNQNGFVRLTGAKINANTKGIDFAWAKKNGAVFIGVAPKPVVKTAVKPIAKPVAKPATPKK